MLDAMCSWIPFSWCVFYLHPLTPSSCRTRHRHKEGELEAPSSSDVCADEEGVGGGESIFPDLHPLTPSSCRTRHRHKEGELEAPSSSDVCADEEGVGGGEIFRISLSSCNSYSCNAGSPFKIFRPDTCHATLTGLFKVATNVLYRLTLIQAL